MKFFCFFLLLSLPLLPYADRFLVIDSRGRSSASSMPFEEINGSEITRFWKGVNPGMYIFPSTAVKCGANSSVTLVLGGSMRLHLDEKSLVWLGYSTEGGINKYQIRCLSGRILLDKPFASERTSRNAACDIYIQNVNASLKDGSLLADMRKLPDEFTFIQSQGTSMVYPAPVSRENPVPAFQYFSLSNAAAAVFSKGRPKLEIPFYPDRKDWAFAFPQRGWKTRGMIDSASEWE